MFTLRQTETYSQDIKKSRFIAICGPVADEQAAKDFIAAHADPTATHNCWAWRCGQAYRFNDDGEPSGTAGKPILQAIDGQALDCVVVLVIRWFGGILLGSGGLMRAYGGIAGTCLRQGEKTEIIATVGAEIICGFSDLALVKARLNALEHLHIDREDFTATGASLAIRLPVEIARTTYALITDLTRGQAIIKPDE